MGSCSGIVATLAMTLLLSSCKGPACVLAAVDRPSIIVVMIDTLRADHTEHHGYDRATTPYLSSLAREGTVFSRLVAASPWTGPSVCSVITGRYPDELGLRALPDPLPVAATTLAELLQEAGYATAAVTSNSFLAEEFGHNQGYDFFFNRVYKGEEPSKRPVFTADRVTDKALEWLETAPSPYFLYVHYTDPHEPYLPPAIWRERFGSGGPTLTDEFIENRQYTRSPMTAEQVQALVDLYDAEIAFADHEIGRLLGGLPEDLLVVVTSDHGEEFKDHEGFLHGHTVFEEQLHVPLVFGGAGICPGVVVEEPVSHVDLLPTILDLANLPVPAGLAGRSLTPHLAGRPPGDERTLFSIRESVSLKEVAARRGDWKLIYDLRGGARLFDLAEDPRERWNVAGKDDPLTLELARLIRERESGITSNREPETDEQIDERLRKLRFLGYVN